MQVADLPAAEAVHRLLGAQHEVQVAQAGVAVDGPVGGLAGALRYGLVVEGEGHGVGLVAEPLVGVVRGFQVHPVDGQDIVPFPGIHAHFREGAAVLRLLVVAAVDLRQAVAACGGIQLDAAPGQGHLGALRQVGVAALGVGVADVELGDELREDVGQVGAVSDVLEPGAVLLPQGLPVIAVHVLHVEEVAEAPPGLVIDLAPLLGGDAVHVEVLGGHGLLVGALGFGLDQLIAPSGALPGPGQDLRAVLAEGPALDLCQHLGLLALLQVEHPESVASASSARGLAVHAGCALGVEEEALDGLQGAQVVSGHGHAGAPLLEAVIVDAHRHGAAGLGLLLAIVLLLGSLADFVTLLGEGMGHILPQGVGDDVEVAVPSVVELQVAHLRGVVAAREGVEVLPLRIPGGIHDREEVPREPVQLLVRQAPHMEAAHAVGVA